MVQKKTSNLGGRRHVIKLNINIPRHQFKYKYFYYY